MQRLPGQPEATQFKVPMIGDANVGKTSIVSRFTTANFEGETEPTVGVSTANLAIDVRGEKIEMSIWDTAGQERFHSMTRAYFRGATAVLLVFDISSRTSFSHLSQWVDDAQKLAPAQAVKVLVGNKSDLSDKREVSTAEAQDFADTHSLSFFETSALSGDRIDDAFMETAHAVYAKMVAGKIDVTPPPQVLPVEPDTPSSEEPQGCNRGK